MGNVYNTITGANSSGVIIQAGDITGDITGTAIQTPQPASNPPASQSTDDDN